ncbi:MAG: sugar transporter [Paracoccaceae bacterium]
MSGPGKHGIFSGPSLTGESTDAPTRDAARAEGTAQDGAWTNVTKLDPDAREQARMARKRERLEQQMREMGVDPADVALPADDGAKISDEDIRKARKAARRASRAARKAEAISNMPVRPVATAAEMRPRHWGVLAGFALMVLLPLAAVGWYMFERAVDQYGSVAGFTVRSDEASSAGMLSGLAAGLGGSSSTQIDTDILFEFIQSRSLVDAIDARFDLRAHYAAPHEVDPIFALAPDATTEQLVSYWSRVVSVAYEQSSGLMEMRVQAFDPVTAQAIAQAILDESQALINALNDQARADTIRYAEIDLEEARQRLREAREALILFRTRTQIVDPETDLQGRLGVVNSLQQQLAQALIEQDLLLEQTTRDDPRRVQARRTIEVIRARIAEERNAVSSGDAAAAGGDAYPQLLAEYEGLQVDREFAEAGYRAALTARDQARNAATRQTRYLASYVQPTLSQVAQYPSRWTITGLAGLFLLLVWSVVVLVYYSIRDSR